MQCPTNVHCTLKPVRGCSACLLIPTNCQQKFCRGTGHRGMLCWMEHLQGRMVSQCMIGSVYNLHCYQNVFGHATYDIHTLEYSFPLLNRGSHAYGSNYNITAILKILNHLRKKSRFQLQSSSGGDPMSRCGEKNKFSRHVLFYN